MLSLFQIVLVCTSIFALIVCIGAMVDNRKIHNFVLIIAIIAMTIIYLLFMCIPIFILNYIYEDSILHISLLLFFTIVATYLFLRVGTQIINNYKIKKVKDEGIYIRDIQVDYSPAVLSYLQNQKIEPKKDLVASILNLCSKDALKLIKKENNKFELECIENFNIESLKKDEKYLYESIKKNRKIDIDIWTLWVKKEYDKYHFSKKNNIKLWIVMIVLCSLYIIFFDMYKYVNGDFTIDDSISFPMLIMFFSAFE